MKTAVIGIGVLLAVLGQPAGATSPGGKEQVCSKTASAAYSACVYEGLDDFWIATGKCKNYADATVRAACLEDLRNAPRESRQECREQKEARLDLCGELGEAPYDPPFEPSLFVNPADIGGSVAPNPWLPIIPGRTLVYRGGDETVTVKVTGAVKAISGVPCAVVSDIVEVDGEVIEDTVDWFAQDLQGNVWYCGEAVQDFENGELVSLDGSFKAGVDGAKPGILMKAAPAVGDVYRLEFDLGNAEDAAEILTLTGSATTPAAICSGICLVTRDFSPLSPDALENKYYAPGIGMILEVKPDSGERLELIEVID
jgi:hypothetical protein